MDVSEIVGQELIAVEFFRDHLRLHFDGPLLTLYELPYVMLTDFSVASGEPEYRNALCAQIGEPVAKASLEEGEALTIELENGVVLGVSLREEDLDSPQAGTYSEHGDGSDEESF